MLYQLTQQAKQDLLAIRRYTLQQWGKGQSSVYLQRVTDTFEKLAEQPGMGQPHPDLGEGVFGFPCEKHRIYYLLHEGNIVVFAVLHQRMLPSVHLTARLD